MIPGEIRQLSSKDLYNFLIRQLLAEKFRQSGISAYPHFGDGPEKPDVLASYGPVSTMNINEDYILLPIHGDKETKDPERIRKDLDNVREGRYPYIVGYIVERAGNLDELFFLTRKAAEDYIMNHRLAKLRFGGLRPVPLHEIHIDEDTIRVGLCVHGDEKLTRINALDLIEKLETVQMRKVRPGGKNGVKELEPLNK